MAISNVIYFSLSFALAIIFSVFALVLEENRVLLKVIAGLSWVIFALLQFALNSPPSTVSSAFALFSFTLGFAFWASTLNDYRQDKKGAFGRGLEG